MGNGRKMRLALCVYMFFILVLTAVIIENMMPGCMRTGRWVSHRRGTLGGCETRAARDGCVVGRCLLLFKCTKFRVKTATSCSEHRDNVRVFIFGAWCCEHFFGFLLLPLL